MGGEGGEGGEGNSKPLRPLRPLRLLRPLRHMKIAVIGAAGYAGGELLRLLLQHPEVTECMATSRSHAGKPIAGVHPALASVSDARFSGATPGEAARGRDVVFLCLEHG